MPVKRRKLKVHHRRITPAAVAAFKAGDEEALFEALGLSIFDCNPLHVYEDGSYSDRWNLLSYNDEARAAAAELRRALSVAAAEQAADG